MSIKKGRLKGPNRSRRDEVMRWQEDTEEPYKKDLNDSGNQDGVVTHLLQTSWGVKSY